MKSILLILVAVATLTCTAGAQEKAAVQTSKAGPFHPGESITFKIKLNEPMPKGSRFDLRVSPLGVDEEVALGSGTPVAGSSTEFTITTKLPEDAYPGEWHISVVWFFLPGAGWTHRTLSTNDLRFTVEGKSYPIPSAADVSVTK